jgi:hypothetical protein
MRALRPPLLLHEGLDASDLEGAADLVEGVAVVAHHAAGLRPVAELLGELQQRELAAGTLGQRGHLGSPSVLGLTCVFQATEKSPVANFLRL